MAARPPLAILTTLRFFAAAEVVAFHIATSPDHPTIASDFLRGLASGGYAAVAFFFVLSGFILTYAHAGAAEADGCDVAAPRFWRLRFARIAPAYYLGLVIAAPYIVVWVLDPAIAPGLRWAGPLLVLLFLQAWWPPLSTLWNFPAWSLSVEWLFYALFPGLARGFGRRPRTLLFAGAYLLIVAATAYRAEFIALDGPIPEGRPDLRLQGYFPLLHLPLFVFGMALGRQFLFGARLSAPLHAAMLGLGAALLLAIFGGSAALPWWTRSDAVLVFVFALVIYGGAGATPVLPWLALPGFVLLGEASYAMYILHVPLRFWWDIAQLALGLSLPRWLGSVAYFAIVVGASVLVFRHVETPLRRVLAAQARPASTSR